MVPPNIKHLLLKVMKSTFNCLNIGQNIGRFIIADEKGEGESLSGD